MTRNTIQLVALMLVGLLTIGAAFLAGQVSGRGDDKFVESTRIANFERLPNEVGLWHHEQDAALDQTGIAMVQSEAHSARVYRHSVTGRKITVVALLGPTGPISAHTPRVCYSATGHQLLSEHVETIKAPSASDAATAEFSCSRWRKAELSDRLTVLHGWSTGRGWEAPTYPRIAFAGKKWLYSLQLVVSSDSQLDTSSEDAELCIGFLTDYLRLAAPSFTASPAPPSVSNL